MQNALESIAVPIYVYLIKGMIWYSNSLLSSSWTKVYFKVFPELLENKEYLVTKSWDEELQICH